MSRRQFWIDVGGTFTDCLVCETDGSIRALKVLSSGVVKGRIEDVQNDGWVQVSGLKGFGDSFFEDYRVRALAPSGEILWTGRVLESASGGLLRVGRDDDSPLAFEVGTNVELDAGEPAPILAIRQALNLGRSAPVRSVDVRLGTTLGTNALLERKGAATALVTTAGFGDVARIGNQNRPRLFDLNIRKPEPLHRVVIEVEERIAADGTVIQELDQGVLREQIEGLRGAGIESIAVCLLNAYRNPAHERVVAAAAAGAGYSQVSVSHELSPTQKIVPRCDTTLLDAYLTPVVKDYVQTIRDALVDSRLRLMTSTGGLTDVDTFSGSDAILSGPAGGVVALAEVSERIGAANAIGFDMGGTSTDVSRFSGELSYEYETEKAGVRIVAPMLAIETVAAGGGSICDFDGQKLTVGPSSAGARPGPACYGAGGPLTVTDVNVFLGRLPIDEFPFSLDVEAVHHRLEKLAERVAQEGGGDVALHELAAGFVRIANANMAAAIQRISVEQGYDVREYTLVSFGGAGGQHACAVADELGMCRVLVHPFAGVLSAYGMGVADVKRFAVHTVLAPYSSELIDSLETILTPIEAELEESIAGEGIVRERIGAPIRLLELRYFGQSSTLLVDGSVGADPEALFEREHRRVYGHVFQGREIEVVAVRIERTGRMDKVEIPRLEEHFRRPSSDRSTRLYDGSSSTSAAIFRRQALRPGDEIPGPAIVVEETATTVIDPGWTGRLLATGDLFLESSLQAEVPRPSPDGVDPAELELFNNRFAAIAEQMGAILQRTSLSVNVKERLDFSCAVFTGDGRLVANAPHMPVHLGAMSETVKCLLEDVPELQDGDVLITNDPFRGGSHLPDITVATPVFSGSSRSPSFFVASRAHHADVGGTHPGSMPPSSRTLEEEGVLIRASKIVEAGRARFPWLRELLTSAKFPARSPDENLADVGAQIAANQAGARGLSAVVDRYGLRTTVAYMEHVQDAAERKVRASLARLPDGHYRFSDRMDEGSEIVLELEIRGDEASLDFSGTSAQVKSNLNANLAIVKAAVIYCFRCLLAEEIPLNEGVLAPLRLIVPEGLLNPRAGNDPATSPAVVGGNVETSQRVTDVIFGALGLVAASQGTMNNLTFGDDSFGYYETICGGSGAGPDFDGADAVHTHMTNTRLTDPEVLEARYPVRLNRFEIRSGSGGEGRQKGGDGVRREIEFLAPLEVSILSQRRTTSPYGLDGGEPGAVGRNTLLPSAGEPVDLGPVATISVGIGDRLLIETPGGGGFGRPGR